MDFILSLYFSKAMFAHHYGFLYLFAKTGDQDLPAISSSATADSSVYYDVMQRNSIIRKYGGDGDDVMLHASRQVGVSHADDDDDDDAEELMLEKLRSAYLILRTSVRFLKYLKIPRNAIL